MITQTRTTCVNCNSDKVLHDASYRYFVLLRGKALTVSSEATATYTSPLFRNYKFVNYRYFHICLLNIEKFCTICHPDHISQFD